MMKRGKFIDTRIEIDIADYLPEIFDALDNEMTAVDRGEVARLIALCREAVTLLRGTPLALAIRDSIERLEPMRKRFEDEVV